MAGGRERAWWCSQGLGPDCKCLKGRGHDSATSVALASSKALGTKGGLRNGEMLNEGRAYRTPHKSLEYKVEIGEGLKGDTDKTFRSGPQWRERDVRVG